MRNDSPEMLLRMPAVLARTGLSRSTLYARIKAGDFPGGLRLTERTRAWPASEVEAWITARIEASREVR